MDSDYLIQQGPQLTWMDAKIGEWAVTPRTGKACEINALWYNALKTASYLGTLLGEEVSPYETLATGVVSSFENTFWNPETNCLFDLVYKDETGNEVKDPAIRPNQIFAVSLPYTMLSPDKEKAIVDRVEKDLLTPFGLRSLSSDHPLYKGQYHEASPCPRERCISTMSTHCPSLNPTLRSAPMSQPMRSGAEKRLQRLM